MSVASFTKIPKLEGVAAKLAVVQLLSLHVDYYVLAYKITLSTHIAMVLSLKTATVWVGMQSLIKPLALCTPVL